MIAGLGDGDSLLQADSPGTPSAQWCFDLQAIPDGFLGEPVDLNGLKDGQEVAGWKVATWREHTMEAIANWSVVSYPWDPDSEDDGNTDFVEFQNGSDPFLADTDGDGYSDWDEANQPGANVTGWHNRPPRIENWNVVKYVADGSLPLFGSGHWVVQVDFDAWALHGIGRWEVSWGTPQLNESDQAEFDALFAEHGDGVFLSCTNSILGGDADLCNAMKEILSRGPVAGATVVGNGGGNATAHVVARFDITVEEAHIAGKWLEARMWDVWGLGVSKKVQVKSTLETIVDIVAAVAKAVVEAASAFFAFLISALASAILGIVDTLAPIMRPFIKSLVSTVVDLVLSIPGARGPASRDTMTFVCEVGVAATGLVVGMGILATEKVLHLLLRLIHYLDGFTGGILTGASFGATAVAKQASAKVVKEAIMSQGVKTILVGAALSFSTMIAEWVVPGFVDSVIDQLLKGLSGGVVLAGAIKTLMEKYQQREAVDRKAGALTWAMFGLMIELWSGDLLSTAMKALGATAAGPTGCARFILDSIALAAAISSIWNLRRKVSIEWAFTETILDFISVFMRQLDDIAIILMFGTTLGSVSNNIAGGKWG